MVALIAVVDSAVGSAFYRVNREAAVHSIPPRSGRTERVIVIFPGYAMAGRFVASAFKPFVGDGDALIAVDYAERGIDIDQIRGKVSRAIRDTGASEIVVYAASMGAMVATEVLNGFDYSASTKVSLVLDTAPASFADVKRPAWLARLGCWYRGGPLATAAWARVAAHLRTPPSADVDPGIVDQAHKAGANIGTAALATQGCFMRDFRLDQNDWPTLRSHLDRTVYLHGSPADDDPLIRTTAAFGRWRIVLPGLSFEEVPGRRGRWHIPIIERPEESVKALLASLDD